MRRAAKPNKSAEPTGNNLPAARQPVPSEDAEVSSGFRSPVRMAFPVRQDRLEEPLWVAGGGPLEAPGKPAETRGTTPTRESEAESQAARVARIETLLVREVTQVRRLGAETLSVVIRPDDETQLMIHLRQRDGWIEAVVRCEQGDLAGLTSQWNQLREALAERNVRLLPLIEAGGGETLGGRLFSSDPRNPHRSPSPEESADFNRRKATGRPPSGSPSPVAPGLETRPVVKPSGWESWA